MVSKWHNNKWYAHWSCDKPLSFRLPTKNLKNKQVFEVFNYPGMRLTYEQIKRQGMHETLMQIRTYYLESDSEFENIAIFQKLSKLRSLIEEFLNDVDCHFKWYNFLKQEWLYNNVTPRKYYIRDELR